MKIYKLVYTNKDEKDKTVLNDFDQNFAEKNKYKYKIIYKNKIYPLQSIIEIIENQNEIALQIAQNKFPFDNGKTCPLFNPDSPYHCSIYNGRAFICRLFGASSFRSRNGDKTWRPCKFYPDEILAAHKPPLAKHQYSQTETLQVLGAVPPLMNDLTEEVAASSSGETLLIHEILPSTIRRLLWLIDMNDNGNDNPNGSPLAA